MEDAAPELNLAMGTPTAGSGVRRIERVREEYLAEQYRRMMEAEHAAGIRADRAAEFAAKYGDTPGAYEQVIWHGPARTAYYYASEELRLHWATHPRLTFAEFAEAAGIRDSKTVARARAARAAREDAARRAAESGTGRDLERKRARDAERRRNRDNSVGAQLERDRRRMAREQARAAKVDEDLRKAGAGVDRDTPATPRPSTPAGPPPTVRPMPPTATGLHRPASPKHPGAQDTDPLPPPRYVELRVDTGGTVWAIDPTSYDPELGYVVGVRWIVSRRVWVGDPKLVKGTLNPLPLA